MNLSLGLSSFILQVSFPLVDGENWTAMERDGTMLKPNYVYPYWSLCSINYRDIHNYHRDIPSVVGEPQSYQPFVDLPLRDQTWSNQDLPSSLPNSAWNSIPPIFAKLNVQIIYVHLDPQSTLTNWFKTTNTNVEWDEFPARYPVPNPSRPWRSKPDVHHVLRVDLRGWDFQTWSYIMVIWFMVIHPIMGSLIYNILYIGIFKEIDILTPSTNMGKKMKETHVLTVTNMALWLSSSTLTEWCNDAMIHWCTQAY